MPVMLNFPLILDHKETHREEKSPQRFKKASQTATVTLLHVMACFIASSRSLSDYYILFASVCNRTKILERLRKHFDTPFMTLFVCLIDTFEDPKDSICICSNLLKNTEKKLHQVFSIRLRLTAITLKSIKNVHISCKLFYTSL